MRRNIRILSLIAVSMLLLPMLSFVMVFAEGESATMVCLRSGEPLYGSDKINVCKTINADEDGNYIVKVVDDVDTDGGDEYRADEDGYNTSPIGVYINGTFFGKTLENAKNYIVIFSDGGNGTSVPILSKQLKDGDVSFTYNVSDYTLTESDGSVTPYDPNTFEELAKTSDEFIDMSEYGPLTISVIGIGGSGDGVETCNYEDDSGSSKFLLNFSDTNGNAYRVGELTGSDYYVELNYYDDLGGGKHQIGTCNIPADAKSVRVIIKDKNNETLFDAAAPDDTSSWTIDFGQYVDENGRIVAHIVAVDGDGETEAKTEEELNQQAYDDMNLSTCESSGAAQSLGWIVCPIMEWMASAAEQIYTDYVEPSLRIEPQLLTGGANATQNAWETFRNIANVVFIIFFMVVIFSQLTGVGIDNYGIKKVLPKLIVIAILVNLSFLICQICVDLSNILGNGLQAMFDSFASNFGNLEISGIEGATEPVAATGGAISAVVILGGVLGVAGLVFNPAMIVTLLIAALGVVISILFLFALLAARQAAVVVLILLSPLALVCYILPNMKKMFDKWLKLWEAMLLLYPICGLLVGGANYVSKLLIYTGMGSQGLFGAFTAMIVGVVPIFFIPTLVKSAFSAMGKLGGTLAGMGARARGGATKRMANSNLNKSIQERGLERQNRIRAGIDRNGNVKNLGRLGVAMRGGKKRVAASRVQYLKNQDTKTRADSLMGVGFEAAQIGQTKKAEKELTADYMTLINDRTRNGEDTGALYRMYENYLAEGNKSGAVAVAKIAGRRKDTADDFMKNYVRNAEIGGYEGTQADAFASVAKEIATGENSGNFRTSAPLTFEFMAQYNRDPASAEKSYANWTSNKENVHRAMDNYITNSQELVGMKGSALRELNQLKENGGMDKTHADRLTKLAGDTIDNRNTTGVWDSTKSDEIYDLAGRSDGGNAGAGAGGISPDGGSGSGVGRVNNDMVSKGQKSIPLAERLASLTAQQQVRAYASQDASSMKPEQLQREDNPVFVRETGREEQANPVQAQGENDRMYEEWRNGQGLGGEMDIPRDNKGGNS